MVRRKIVAGNWKMNLMPAEGKALVQDVLQQMPELQEHQYVYFCTPYLHITAALDAISNNSKKHVNVGAQNCHPQPSGAYTGEISIPMLKELAIKVVLVGHSERRQYFAETNAFLKQKIDALLEAELKPIFCCGEALDIREANTQNEYVAAQINESLFHLNAEQFAKVIIAYEPIWAIGTGKTASSAQAQEMHAFIRSTISKKYGADVANSISILYGGSCNHNNAAELFALPDVDGGLIGGAALKAETFVPIINALA